MSDVTRFSGKTVFITGAARGQGRAHALRFAAEGANVVAIDMCKKVDTSYLEASTVDELDETRKLAEDLGAEVLTSQLDIRDSAALQLVVSEALERFGSIDVVVANAAIVSNTVPFWEIEEQAWRDVVDTNLTGTWLTMRAIVPSMIEAGKGGSLIIINSAAGLQGYPGLADYVASKHGGVGLMRTMAQELGQYEIRVNSIHSSNVKTPMYVNATTKGLFAPGLGDDFTEEELERASRPMHLLPVGWVLPDDISNAVLWLASDESRYVTGATLPVDAGALAKN